MHFERYMRKICSRLIFLVMFFLSLAGKSYSLEPLTALDDGFSLPADGSMEESSLFFPGSELFIGKPFALIGYSTPFGMEDLAVSTFIAGAQAGRIGFSISWNGSGGDLYGDEQEKLGFSYSLLKSISLGARLSRSAMRIRGFGNASTFSADAGLIIHPVESFYLAVSMENATGARLGESKEPLDGRTRAAASWSLPGAVTLIGSLTKVCRFDPSFSGGCVMKVWDSLSVGVLGANAPNRMEFLSSLLVKGMKFSYRGSYQGDLGFTHGVSVGWSGKK
jgi:hypothetical protein